MASVVAAHVEIRKCGDGRYAVHERIPQGQYSNDAWEPLQYVGDPSSGSAVAALIRWEAYFEAASARRERR